jgi:CDP-2,3-bis-(O-geranylgeranyl)-sn-glycerol synthase
LGFLLLIIMDVSGILPITNSLWGAFPHNIILIVAMAVGSLVGDMIGSFFKRMMDRPRGMRTPFLDQWDYLLGSALFILPFYPWWYDTLVADHHWIALLIFPAIAYAAHVIANRIGFWIGVKKEPW